MIEEKSIEKDIWILNPDYSFRNDIDRICMFSNRQIRYDGTPDWVGFIHPVQAMILGVFTEAQDLSETIQALSSHFNLPYSTVSDLIEQFKENKSVIHTEWQGFKVWFPENVLIKYNPSSSETDEINYTFSAADLQCSTVDLKQDRCHRGPLSALWMLTSKCFTNCKYCYADRKTRHNPLTTEKILDLIDEFHDIGMSYIDVIGGEIFLHKDWDVILKKLVDCNMTPTYISTKVPITESIMSRLEKTGYRNVVQISLDSMNDVLLRDLIGAGENYVERIKYGISLLERSGYSIQIDTVLTCENATKEEICKLYEYVRTIKNLRLWEIRVPESSIYSNKTYSEVMADKKALVKIQNYVSDILKLKSNNIRIVFSATAMNEQFNIDGFEKQCFNGGTCGVLKNRVFILPDGKVSVCEQLYWHPQYIIGDLTVSSMQEIWNSKRALEIFNMEDAMFRSTSPCVSCANFCDCTNKRRRCLVKVIKAYGIENWDYPDPRCKYAPEFDNALKY